MAEESFQWFKCYKNELQYLKYINRILDEGEELKIQNKLEEEKRAKGKKSESEIMESDMQDVSTKDPE